MPSATKKLIKNINNLRIFHNNLIVTELYLEPLIKRVNILNPLVHLMIISVSFGRRALIFLNECNYNQIDA